MLKNVSPDRYTGYGVECHRICGNMTTHLDLKKYLPDNVTFADDAFDGRVNVTVQIEKERGFSDYHRCRGRADSGTPTGLEGELAEESVTVPVRGTCRTY